TKTGTVGVETKKGKSSFVLAESRAFDEPTKLLFGHLSQGTFGKPRGLTYLKFDGSSRPFGNSIESFPILPNLPLFKSHFQYALTESLKQGDEEDCLGRPIEFKRE
ncbi:MAG: hypothetical protein VX479_00825, partial [Verrucomicrobiota bacterium]|nr:hypothetical protein [Verrucomicrobiota bacterium]